MHRIAWIVLLAGCGNFWKLDPALEGECRETFRFFTDVDGDGWGDPEGLAQDLCAGDASRSLTALNGLDCDDGDPLLSGGGLGSVCPTGLVAAENGSTVALAAAWSQDSEFVAVFGGASRLSASLAETACGWWGSGDTVGEGFVGFGDAHLAILSDSTVRVAVQDAVDASPGLSGDFEAFVGIRWEGGLLGEGLDASWVSSVEDPEQGTRIPGRWDGEWIWGDGVAVDAGLWCGEPPTPSDLHPGLSPDDDANEGFWEGALPGLRLALIRDGSGWCVGVPGDGGTPDAHVVCERPRADASAFEGYPAGSPD